MSPKKNIPSKKNADRNPGLKPNRLPFSDFGFNNARRFRLPAMMVLLLIITFSQLGYGQICNVPEHQQLLKDETPAPAETLKTDGETQRDNLEPSALWRSCILDNLPPDDAKRSVPEPIGQAYRHHDWQPIFIDSNFGLKNTATQLLARLKTIEKDAIDPNQLKIKDLSQSLEKLEQCRSALMAVDPEIRDSRVKSFSRTEPMVLAAAAFANQSSDSRPPPTADPAVVLERYLAAFRAAGAADIRLTKVFVLFAKEMDPFLPQEELEKALLGEVPVATFLDEIEPKASNYKALHSAYQKYKNLAAQGAQRQIAIPAKVHRGESGNQISELQKRLRLEGFYSGKITGVYDSETQKAVKEFQSAHLLEPDGAIGQRTREWLNVSFQRKAELIASAMKAVRQSPSRIHDRFIRINIPQFVLEYYKDGKLQEVHRIVVGKASGKKVKFRGRMVGENQTPTLSSSIERIILNPRWYVSDRIRLELDTQAKSDPEWFSKHGYVNMSSRYPWGAPRLFQSPGPKNALGRVKFEFPNPYAVYLHDTPLKHLFARSRRDFSHGCIRVDKAVELAETLLNDDASRYVSKMKSVLEGSNQLFAKLSQPLPISIEYVPVISENERQIVFLGDPYDIVEEEKLPEKG